METLFYYLTLLSGKSFTTNEIAELQRVWHKNNPHCLMPDFNKLQLIYGYANVYICRDVDHYYVLDYKDKCIEVCNTLEDIKCKLIDSKTIVM